MNHVYYCAIGKQYLDLTRISAASVRRHNPDVIITVLTDQSVEAGPFDRVVSAGGDAKDIVSIKLARISFLESINAERALYLDCDTFVVADLSPVFDLLDSYDIAVAYDTWRNCSVTPYGTYMNAGVIFFRSCDRVRRLWQEWRRAFLTDPTLPARPELIRDQPTLETALHACRPHLFVLAPEYNVRICEPIHVAGHVKILHGDFATMLDGSIERLVQFLNTETGPRVFIPSTGQMLVCNYTGLHEVRFTRAAAEP
jgi:hypothetical protein